MAALTAHPSHGTHRFAAVLGLLILTVSVYAPVRDHAFLQFDDADYVTENPMVRGGLTPAGIRQAFTTFYAGNWHPLTWVSHMVDVEVCGMAAGCHLFFNVFLHAGTGVLLFLWLSRATGREWPSLFVAALFAVHPLHVESVAWVAERKDVLHGFWWMAAVTCYVEYACRERARQWYVAMIVCAALAFLSKPMAVTLPFVLLLLDIWPLRRGIGSRLRQGYDGSAEAGLRTLPRPAKADIGSSDIEVLQSTPRLFARLVIEKSPLFLMAAALAVATWQAQAAAGAIQATETFPIALRLANAAQAYIIYIGQTLWPVDLAALYPYPDMVPPWKWAAALAILIGMTLMMWRLRTSRPYLLSSWLLFLGMLVPVIGIVQVGAQPYADRYMYLPMLGLLIIAVWAVADFAGPRRVAQIAALGGIAAVTACAALTARQVAVWANDVSLWTHATTVTAHNYRALTNLGFAHATAQSARQAMAAYDAALRIKPGFAQALSYRASLHADLGEAVKAEADARAAIAERPRMAEAHNTLGLILASQDRLPEAIASFRTAVDLQPRFGQAWNNLGIALAMSGQLPRALEAFQQSVPLQPESGEAHLNLGTALSDSGRSAEARPHLERAVQLGPAEVVARAREVLGRK